MTTDKEDKFSWRKRAVSFKYAFRGIINLLDEHNARIHVVVACLVVIAGFVCKLSKSEWCLVILCIGGVLMAEGFNTSIEALCDKVDKKLDPLIRKAKDVAAGSVLLMVVGAVVVGLIIFIPKILKIIDV